LCFSPIACHRLSPSTSSMLPLCVGECFLLTDTLLEMNFPVLYLLPDDDTHSAREQCVCNCRRCQLADPVWKEAMSVSYHIRFIHACGNGLHAGLWSLPGIQEKLFRQESNAFPCRVFRSQSIPVSSSNAAWQKRQNG
jgi:hypothetical protein